jgi:ubiquinone/menaquinone biosynthesis C-methylase UbiE
MEARRRSWSQYWASGLLHSCPGSFAGNYDGAIAEFWAQSFARLGPGQRVLDIATGNGALPRLLLGVDGGNDFDGEIDAIDLARMAPDWLGRLRPAQRSRLHFHPGTDAEALPFADGQFNLVISQYGIEYADLDRALVEAARVLVAQGSLCLLMHHRQSLPVQKAEAELEILAQLRGDADLLACARRMLPWIALAASAEGRSKLAGNAQAQADRTRFNVCQQAIDGLIAGATAESEAVLELRDDVQQVLALAQTRGRASAEAALQALAQRQADQQLRARELIAHALDQERMQAVLQLLGSLEFASVSAQPLHYRQHLMGWTLIAERPPAR